MRVLAMNDDNHATSFVTENGETYYNAYEFITKCLAKPHKTEYQIRGFVIYDDIEGLGEEEIQCIFECVVRADEEVYNSELGFTEAFNLLWAFSSERWS